MACVNLSALHSTIPGFLLPVVKTTEAADSSSSVMSVFSNIQLQFLR